ncbi:MAG: 3-hydroxyacyl-CoA dehydrogenase/enoyl-CoA hydratase family protein [Candidatus Njordarchaeia archaeon]
MEIKKIAVLGAGTMGHGIAQVAAMSGFTVYVRDIGQEFLDRAKEKISWSLNKLASKGKISKEEAEAILSRLHFVIDLKEAVKDADFVIEAVPEKMEIKRETFEAIDKIAPQHAVLATNTSSLPITEIAASTNRPEKVIGMHFFNPPVILPLVEIIRGEKTSDETVEITKELAKKFGKEVVIVNKDVPGFIVNRILGRVLNEACWVTKRKGYSIVEIDSALRYKVGIPMGAFELADYSGIDVFYFVFEAMTRRGYKAQICPDFKEKFEKKEFGSKTGKGFYTYPAPGKHVRPNVPEEAGFKVDPKEILAPAVNEAAWLIRENVATPEDIDKAVKLGLNYPRGILEMADEWGIDRIVGILEAKREYGEEYEPDPLLREMVQNNKLGVKTGEGFYKYKVELKEYGPVILRKEPDIAWVIINRPKKLNALNHDVFNAIGQIMDDLWNDEEVKVIIITGSGDRAFSAGADIEKFVGLTGYKAFIDSRKFQSIFDKIERIPKPVIAMINGYALGGGNELAMSCDFRIVGDNAMFGQPEINLGIIPGAGGTQRLVKLIGLSRAKELMMTGKMINAFVAEKFGLVNKVVPKGELEDYVRNFAKELASKPPLALALIKYSANFGNDIPIDVGQTIEALSFGVAFSTEDSQEGVDAFLSKRKPKFKGK